MSFEGESGIVVAFTPIATTAAENDVNIIRPEKTAIFIAYREQDTVIHIWFSSPDTPTSLIAIEVIRTRI